jgi:hypothetical protein
MARDTKTAISPENAAAKAAWHRAQASQTLKDKVRILLKLQRDELPLLQRQRPLRSWEKPWPIEP